MKTNKLNYSIKGTFLALALTSLSFSAQAANYIINDGEGVIIDNEVQASGSFRFFGHSDAEITDSHLGNSSGGRFSIYSEDPTPDNQFMVLFNSTLYVDLIDGPTLFELALDNSFLYADDNAIDIYSLSIYDASILVANGVTAYSLGIGDDSTWKTTGSSTLVRFSVFSGSIEYTVASAFDSITVDSMVIIGESHFKFNFTDDFIESIFLGVGYYDLSFTDTIVYNNIMSFSGGTYDINVADSNDSYCWTVEDLGDETYRISNIIYNPIPEPSTYAAIFGLIALAFVAYKRRK